VSQVVTRQSFSRLPQIDRLIVRIIIFNFFRFSNAPFFNLGATGFCSKWRARAPRREPSEGCFSEPHLLASHTLCPNSILALFCLQVYHLQCTVYTPNVSIGPTSVHWILRRILRCLCLWGSEQRRHDIDYDVADDIIASPSPPPFRSCQMANHMAIE
jgi:hypothetical protein